MKKLTIPLFIVLAVAAFAFTSSASAAEGKTLTPQQEKMANCAHENKGKKGDEYKQGMRDCLHGKSAAGAMKNEEHKAKTEEKKADSKVTAQREKMKTCNAQAKEKNLKGKDRRDFMSGCLKADG